jgi:5-(aminomethyl)-3-furanmethanol phosphate kinase
MRPVVVAKVGGSLFDLPDFRDRLLSWADRAQAERIVLFPGGGAAADVVRCLDRVHRLGESAAHWLAIRMLTVNAHFLAALLDVPVVDSPTARAASRIVVLEPHSFCRADEGQPGAVGHSWSVTSDSIAARVASIAGGPLVLLKSMEIPEGVGWEGAAANGLVDDAFADVIRGHDLAVSWVNLRGPEFAIRK